MTGRCPARNKARAASFIARTFAASLAGSSPVPDRYGSATRIIRGRGALLTGKLSLDRVVQVRIVSTPASRRASRVCGPFGWVLGVGGGLVGDEAVRRAERGDLTERADAELGRVRDGDRAGGLAEPGLLDGGVVEGELRPAVLGVHAADGHDEAVEGQGFQRPQRQGSDE